ncbi:hypothetical protein ATB98_04440 [Sinorhizobium saheli]|uniref:Amidohydrolase n=1 Tax=Sinorhizobium saheli TaxID=36856 RepID=A0A178YEN9_SINSA|nr:hypothetical protein ATB98_04440 [Sinorhizobium saheli]
MTVDRDALHEEMIVWRRDLHAHLEFGFDEKRTSAFVAKKLREFGFDDVVGGTGVVGTLRRGSGNRKRCRAPLRRGFSRGDRSASPAGGIVAAGPGDTSWKFGQGEAQATVAA